MLQPAHYVKYTYFPASDEAPHIFRYKAGHNFYLTLGSLRGLIRHGLSRIQVNEPGFIDIYFTWENAPYTEYKPAPLLHELA